MRTESFRALVRDFGGRCAWCNACYEPAPSLAPVKLTRDHILPVSKGGGGVLRNVLPACADCNARRGNRHPIAWWLESGFTLRAATATLLVPILAMFPDWTE